MQTLFDKVSNNLDDIVKVATCVVRLYEYTQFDLQNF